MNEGREDEQQRDGVPPSEEDGFRASYYALLSRLLVEPPTAETLGVLRGLEGDDSSPIGQVLSTLAKVANTATGESAENEYTELFYGKGQGGEVLPYASYYLTGLVYDKPLAKLRGDMQELGLAHAGKTGEPEDHAGYILEMMHSLIVTAEPGTDDARQRQFFDDHIAPWMGKFFEDLEAAEASVLYAPIGALGRLFVTIEADAFKMAA